MAAGYRPYFATEVGSSFHTTTTYKAAADPPLDQLHCSTIPRACCSTGSEAAAASKAIFEDTVLTNVYYVQGGAEGWLVGARRRSRTWLGCDAPGACVLPPAWLAGLVSMAHARRMLAPASRCFRRAHTSHPSLAPPLPY